MPFLTNPTNFIGGVGEMASLVRSKDWSQTPLGPIESWSQSLRTTVGLCLSSNFPINIIWGKQHTQIYNDGYKVLCGEKYSSFLGTSYTVSWASAWAAIGLPFEQALSGNTSFIENQSMFLYRNGYLEETFFTFSISPIYDETGNICGLFHPVTETTLAMLSQRRMRAIRDLTADLAKAKTTPAVFDLANERLTTFSFDIPFVLIYHLIHVEKTEPHYRLAASIGLPAGTAIAPDLLDLAAVTPWPVDDLVRLQTPVMVAGIADHLGSAQCGPYDEPPNAACVVPIKVAGSDLPVAIMVAGVSARLPYNDAYQNFYELIGAAIGTALVNAKTYEMEHVRAEALAEIGRVKTAFFSNVSHEFRTPLTLMLSPLEEVLSEETIISKNHRQLLQFSYNNALRVLKLVNSLLDFAHIEAGRSQARFEPVDLARSTTELASNFRSACELAGLKLVVDCQPLAGPVYVDCSMWEKIVLNLVSNAFKYTLTGQITVSLTGDGATAELIVRDTGIGISGPELPRVFERFHRINDLRCRSHEGSGIGLALVESLIKLHGGTVVVQSVPEQGSAFHVTIPMGKAHLAPDTIKTETGQHLHDVHIKANAYVQEALRWLPETAEQQVIYPGDDTAISPVKDTPRIVLAEDNADMRAYITRILVQGGYDVQAVANGVAALAIARQDRRPDLVLTDVMMPALDGFGLLKEIRAGADTKAIVVILLSARAGEEARVEGLAAGADDYIVKPFSARELRARVDAAINLARQREEGTVREENLRAEIEAEKTRTVLQESNQRLEFALEAGRLGSWEFDLPTRQLKASAICLENFGLGSTAPQNLHDTFLARIHPNDRRRQRHAMVRAIRTHAAVDIEHRMISPEGHITWVEVCGRTIYAANGTPLRMVGVSLDVTTRKHAEGRQKLLLDELNHRVKNTLAIVQSIAMQTQRNAVTPGGFFDDLMARLAALARAHDLLSEASWDGALLADVIEQTLAYYATDTGAPLRVAAAGPAIKLGPSAAVTLNMAFHELATNAAKYGALSVPEGKIDVRWQIDATIFPAVVDIIWLEMDGPTVETPSRRGFGLRLIERGLTGEMGGTARIDFFPNGVNCHMRLPVSDKISFMIE